MYPSISRRTALKLGAAAWAGSALPALSRGNEQPGPNPASPRDTRLTGLMQNEDCTDFFAHQEFPAGQAGEIVDRYVDVLAGAGVSVLMCNTNARRTNYRSQVWEAFWDGYDPDGPDDQPFLSSVPPDRRTSYRKLVGNMLATHNAGVDYPARIIQRCRHHGISPWISLRMNDVHENHNLDHPFHSALWRKPELFRQGDTGHFARALDYAHAEVREHYRALIVETLERYDVEGLELDFLREPYLFSKGKEAEGRQILTDWLRSIRALVDDAAKRSGHEVKLGVRVPSDPETALGLGFDAPTWAEEGLVDLVTVAPRWSTLQFDMPMEKWREMLGERVTLAGGLEVSYSPSPGTPSRRVTPEEANGAALAILSGGADAVYLFNFFQNGHPGWPIPEYQQALKALSSLEALRKLPRRHAVTYRDVTIPGEAYRTPLPASGTRLSFALPLGPVPAPDWLAEIVIEFAALRAGDEPPAVFINGTAGTLQHSETLENGNGLATFAIPATAVSDRNRDTIEITAAGNDPVKVLRVEVGLRPPD